MIIWITVREFGEFIIIALFHNTPLWVIVLTAMLLLILLFTKAGWRVGRLSEIIGPIVLLMITFVIILNVGNMNWDYMRPIYHDSGWLPILKGSYTPVAAFFGEAVMMMMFVFFMDKPEQASSRAMWGVGLAVFMVTIGTLAVILTFGPNLSSSFCIRFTI